MGKYSHYGERDWYEFFTSLARQVLPEVSMRDMLAGMLNRTVALASDDCPGWEIRHPSPGAHAVILGSAWATANPALVAALQRWIERRSPGDDVWTVTAKAPSFAALVKNTVNGQGGYTFTFDKEAHAAALKQARASDPHVEAAIAMRAAEPTVSCALEQTEWHTIAKNAEVTVTINGIAGGPVKLPMHVAAGESTEVVMQRARDLACAHMLPKGLNERWGTPSQPAGPSPAMAVASAPQWNTGMGFRFDAPTSPDAIRKEYMGEWVAQGGTFRFAGRDYPYKSTSEEIGARTFVCEMEAEQADQLYAGPRVGMLVMDECSVGVVEMLTTTRANIPTRRNVDRLTLTFGLQKPVVKRGDYVSAKDFLEQKGQRAYVGHNLAAEQAHMDRVVNEHLAKAFPFQTYGSGFTDPERERLAREAVRDARHQLEALSRKAFIDEWCAVDAPRKQPDPALAADLTVKMSATILGPTHDLDRAVERESANVPVKCDPARWGNVVRAIAAHYTERRRTEAPGVAQQDGEWNTSAARELTNTLSLLRPFLASYEAFRREGYSRAHSYQRALGKPGDEAHIHRLAWPAYEAAK